MKLEVDAEDFTTLYDEDAATALHEYIHYLQDITTTRGLTSIVNKAQKLQLIFSYAKDENYTFDIPYRSIENMNKIAEYNAQFEKILNGDCMRYNKSSKKYEAFKVHHIDKIIEEKDDIQLIYEEYIDDGRNITQGYIVIYFDGSEDRKSKRYVFGSDCVAESMAYLCEHIFYNSEERHNEFPYNACEMVCEYVFPEILNNKAAIVALCEVSLMNENSGGMFFSLLNFIKFEDVDYNNLEQLKDSIFSYVEHNFNEMEKKLEMLEESISFLYPFQNMDTYYMDKIMNGINYRKKSPLFISKLIEKKDKNELYRIFNELGFPIMITSKNEVYSNIPESFHILSVLSAYELFTTNAEECFLCDICEKQKNNIYKKEICRKTPWKKTENSELCPLSAFLWRYSISSYRISRKEF